MNPQPGEVWTADLGFAAKIRPVVIVSRSDSDPPRALAIYVPVTSQNRASSYEVILPKTRFLQAGSVANVQAIGSVATVRLGRKLGQLSADALRQIKKAIVWALELSRNGKWC